jgi:formate dehydrogenase iron-sulfur subunit
MSARLEHRASLVDLLLTEQAELRTAVGRFSAWHDTHESREPAQAKHYRGLIPFSKPGRGEQYAFEVNLDQCTGCKACVAACHSLNGLDDNESWRDVGVLIGDTVVPYQQTVTTACHHCLEPACANGCPVLAYEKDAETGIVRHLDDQCIGCSYCILKCPYDVPKFNAKRGIVRKCDMCQQRLSVGEAPACVQACPSGAIAIRIVNVSDVQASIKIGSAALLPGAFDSAYTQPTTRYVSAVSAPAAELLRTEPNLHLEEAHWPLAWMLVLTQMATGMFLAAALLRGGSTQVLGAAGLGTLTLGLMASVLHLGQPRRAWRCFLGWRKSWLSREILVFGGFGGAGILACFTNAPSFMLLTATLGLLGVFCSAMVYVDTRRPFWAAWLTFTKFFGTTVLLGATAAAVLLGWTALKDEGMQAWAQRFAITAALIRAALFIFEQTAYRNAKADARHPWHRSARIMRELTPQILQTRMVLFIVSTVFGLATIGNFGGFAPGWATASFLSTFGSQMLERHLFFVAVNAPRMPGMQPHHAS